MTNECLPGRRDVVLVAHEPPNSEHLGIRLVAAGLAEAGFRPRVLPLATPSSLAAVVSETLAAQPFLVGVSISDPLVAPLLLAFVRLLRQRGFAGHITAGGALATLERGKLLANHPAIDSVVRHAGEAVIVELARALGDGGNLDQVPGLTTRLGEGRGNPHAFTPSHLRPLRAEEPPTLIGIPKADVAGGYATSAAHVVHARWRAKRIPGRLMRLPHARGCRRPGRGLLLRRVLVPCQFSLRGRDRLRRPGDRAAEPARPDAPAFGRRASSLARFIGQ